MCCFVLSSLGRFQVDVSLQSEGDMCSMQSFLYNTRSVRPETPGTVCSSVLNDHPNCQSPFYMTGLPESSLRPWEPEHSFRSRLCVAQPRTMIKQLVFEGRMITKLHAPTKRFLQPGVLIQYGHSIFQCRPTLSLGQSHDFSRSFAV